MAKPKSKEKLLEEIRARHLRLEEKIASLPREVLLRPKTVGAWSVKDTVAHITAWEKSLLSRYYDGLAGRPVKDGHTGETLGAVNHRIFEENLSRSLDDVMADFTATYQRILAAVASIPEEDMFARGKFAWTGQYRLLDYIWGNTAGHYTEHLAAINRMKL
jgi:hypothetical protein